MKIEIPLKEAEREIVDIVTVRDGGSMYLQSRCGDKFKSICWINNQMSSQYRGMLFKPYDRYKSRELFPVKKEELSDFVETVRSYLNKVEATNEYIVTQKAAFEREIRKLSEQFDTYYQIKVSE